MLDGPHLCYCWLNKYFVDTRLPFGSRSSLFIFNQFAEALLWILVRVFGIPYVIHHLDNFLLCNYSHEICARDIVITQSVFQSSEFLLHLTKLLVPLK